MKNHELKEHLEKILRYAGYEFDRFNVFPSMKKEFGDFSTNLLFKIKDPTQTKTNTEKIIYLLQQDNWIQENFEKIEEKNSFINFFLKENIIYSTIPEILSKKHEYGKSSYGEKKESSLSL